MVNLTIIVKYGKKHDCAILLRRLYCFNITIVLFAFGGALRYTDIQPDPGRTAGGFRKRKKHEIFWYENTNINKTQNKTQIIINKYAVYQKKYMKGEMYMKLTDRKVLIIVTGGPGTGKSYAAKQILAGFDDITALSYDSIKEKEWDRFGFDNAEQKARLNRFCLEEFYLTLQKMMWEEKSVLIEYPFNYSHREQLASLIDENGYKAVTVYLYGDWRVIYERGISRDKSKNVRRHPGHLTNCYHLENGTASEAIVPDAMLTYEQFRRDIDRKNYDIRLGTTIPVDVTDYSSVDYQSILAQIASALN